MRLKILAISLIMIIGMGLLTPLGIFKIGSAFASNVIVDEVSGASSPNNKEFFVPKEVTITVSDTVIWTNSDSTLHTVTSGDVNDSSNWGQLFDSGLQKPGTTFHHTFDASGEYPYLCQIHPWMVGKVIVAAEEPQEEIESSQQILFQTKIKNSRSQPQPFTFIVQIKDNGSITQSVSWISGTLAAGQSTDVTQSWISALGRYQVGAFIWQGLDRPIALSPALTTNLSIAPTGEISSDSKIISKEPTTIFLGQVTVPTWIFFKSETLPVVTVEKGSYVVGETVRVTGTVPPVLLGAPTTLFFNVKQIPLTIKVLNPSNVLYAVGQPTPDANRTYSFEFRIGGKLGTIGLYTVSVSYGDMTEQIKFELKEDFTKGDFAIKGEGARLGTDESGTPLQRAILEEIEKLKGKGPHPTILENQTRTEVIKGKDSNGRDFVRIQGKVVLQYDSPKQAGKERWDDFIIKTESGDVVNYNQQIIEQFPKLYGPGAYTLGEEPRIYTILENFTITYPLKGSTNVIAGPPTFAFQNAYAEMFGPPYVVMGFTMDPPDIDWSIEERIESCVDNAGCFTILGAANLLKFEIDFGLRFPTKVTIDTPTDVMKWDHEYPIRTTLEPTNLDADQYAKLGIPPLEGKEFQAKFVFSAISIDITIPNITSIHLGPELLGLPAIPDINIDLAEKCTEQLQADCSDFVTPFGYDEEGRERLFKITRVTLDPDKTGLKYSFGGASVGLGLGIEPSVASKTVKTNWQASGDSIASEGVSMDIVYTPEALAQIFGPVKAGNYNDAQDEAVVTLDSFKFYFDNLYIGLSFNVQFGGWLKFLVSDSPYVELVRFDLSELMEGSDLYLPEHESAKDNFMTLAIPTSSPESDISVKIKHTNKMTLMVLTNSGDETISHVKIAIDKGTISFVKLFRWERDRIDDRTIVVQAKERPANPGAVLRILFIVDNKTADFQWAAHDSGRNLLASGSVRPSI